MGGPGCGKGTQCKNVATKYGFCHVGLGQLLTQEGQCSTQWGWEARDIMLQGLLVPTVGRAPDLIMFDCSMDVMVCRVWHRGQKEHRVRDCESALRQGLETYDTLCEPVLTSYQQNNLLRNADLGRSSSRRHFAQCCSVTERLQ
ncbi:adenylate kinase isoenzyme 1-like [Puma concolor]|uniref:Adenylate kinase isoenzyme 1-like n=1 Tax=Puma concolor TaxID=9696 RepID=A0A6P6H9F4_PUMCO|nr:adenylate kinase isoenzyme 1-like [Puma concolor]